MQYALPHGLWPVMLTAFDEEGELDWHGIDALTDWYIEAGSAGLFACCLSSEMYHLTPQERLGLVRRVVRRANGRVPVVATGAFGGSIPAQAESMAQMADTGVAAVVVLTNQLVPQDAPESLFQQQLEALLDATGQMRLGFYECPSPHRRLLSPELSGWAAQTGRFLYLKDTSCDMQAIQAKLDATRNTPFGLFNAHQPTTLASLEAGAAGVSPTAANYYPELFVWLCQNPKHQKAEFVQEHITEMMAVTRMQYPASAKYFLQQRGLPITTRCRVNREVLSSDTLRALGGLRDTVQTVRQHLTKSSSG